MAHKMHKFANASALAESLADRVAQALAHAITERGEATIAVSGGSTPKSFFEALSQRPIDWARVQVTLVDERFVPADHARSNHLLVASHLLKNAAAMAKFVPLYRDTATIEEAAAAATLDLPGGREGFDVAVLGMGTDGHTASFFPGGDHLAAALDLSQPRRVMTMQAPGAGEARLTLSFCALYDARLLIIHIEGAEKMAVLQAALSSNDESEMPIRAVLERAATTPNIYWAP